MVNLYVWLYNMIDRLKQKYTLIECSTNNYNNYMRIFIMNKKNILLTAGLMFSVVTVALPVGKQVKGVAYHMHALGQDFSQSSFVKENIDRLIYLFGMNIKIAEKQLQSMDGCVTTVVKNSATILPIAAFYAASLSSINYVMHDYRRSDVVDFITVWAKQAVNYGCLLMFMRAALSAHDAFKNKKALKRALALDKAILVKLVELRESMTLQGSIDEYDQHVEICVV